MSCKLFFNTTMQCYIMFMYTVHFHMDVFDFFAFTPFAKHFVNLNNSIKVNFIEWILIHCIFNILVFMFIMKQFFFLVFLRQIKNFHDWVTSEWNWFLKNMAWNMMVWTKCEQKVHTIFLSTQCAQRTHNILCFKRVRAFNQK